QPGLGHDLFVAHLGLLQGSFSTSLFLFRSRKTVREIVPTSMPSFASFAFDFAVAGQVQGHQGEGRHSVGPVHRAVLSGRGLVPSVGARPPRVFGLPYTLPETAPPNPAIRGGPAMSLVPVLYALLCAANPDDWYWQQLKEIEKLCGPGGPVNA